MNYSGDTWWIAARVMLFRTKFCLRLTLGALLGLMAFVAGGVETSPKTTLLWDFAKPDPHQQAWKLVRDKEPPSKEERWQSTRSWDFTTLKQDAWEWQFSGDAVRQSSQGVSFETRETEAAITLVNANTIVSADQVELIKCDVEIAQQPVSEGANAAFSWSGTPWIDWETLDNVINAPDGLFKHGATRSSWPSTDSSGRRVYLCEPSTHPLWKGNLAAFRIRLLFPRALTAKEPPYVVTLRGIQFARRSDLARSGPPKKTSEGLSFASQGASWSLALNGQSLQRSSFDTVRIAFRIQQDRDKDGSVEEVRLLSTPMLYWALRDPARKGAWPFEQSHAAQFISTEIVTPRHWEARPPLGRGDVVSDLLISVSMPPQVVPDCSPYQVTIQRIEFLHTGANGLKWPLWFVGCTAAAAFLLHALLSWKRKRLRTTDANAHRDKHGVLSLKELLLFSGVCLLLKGIVLFVDAYPIIHADSPSYMTVSHAVTETPAARPVGYSLIIWLLRSLTSSEDLHTLILGQTLIGVGVSILVLFMLRRLFGLPRRAAWPLALLVALSPMNLALERAILSETGALFLYAAVLACSFLMFQTPWTITVLVTAVLAALLQEFRHVYVLLPAVLAALLLLRVVFCKREDRVLWAVSALCFYLTAFLVSNASDRLFMSNREPSHEMSEKVVDSGSGLAFGYWCMWGRWARVAESHDLDEYEWGPLLLADISDLHQKDQWWRPDSATNRFLRTCPMTEIQRKQVFKTACIEMIKHHPFGVTALVVKEMWDWFAGSDAAPPTTRVGIDAESIKVIGGMAPDAAALINETNDGWSFSPMLEDICIGFSRVRGIFLAAVAAMWFFSAFRLKTRFPAFALASVTLVYFLSINVSAVMIERYYQPVELSGVIAIGYLLGGLMRSTHTVPSENQQQKPS